MIKLRKLISPKQPQPSEIESDKVKQQDQGVQYSDTLLQQNGDDKEENPVSSLQNDGTLQNDRNPSLDQREESISIAAVQEEQIQAHEEQDQIVQENDTLNNTKRREGSGDSIVKSKKYHSDEACNVDTCSKVECASSTCNRIIHKKRATDKEIDSSKLTEMINTSIKEAMQTMIKQCTMDNDRVTTPKKKTSQERPKIQTIDKSACRPRQDAVAIVKRSNDDDEKYISRKRCYPCDYSQKYDKRSSAIKTTKKRTKESYDGSTFLKYHPVKDNVCEKGTKKHFKSPKNVKTDNRRMTGNVNIYICSEANENAQCKEKQKEKSESCTESCSETTTRRTNSSCVRTPSVLSSKLASGIQKRRKKLQGQGSINYFQGRENRVTRSNHSNDTCSGQYENDSSITLKGDDRLELSTLSSRSTEIDSTMSSVSSTRDGCCCEDTVSSYVGMHRQDPMRLKPKFIDYDDETDGDPRTTRIFPKSSNHSEVEDSWMQRRNRYSNSCRCCHKGNVKYGNRTAKRRSSFDILHEKDLRRKWSRCSCIVEEDEEDHCTNIPVKREVNDEKWTICRNNVQDSKERNLPEFTVCKSLNNRGETPQEFPDKNEEMRKSVTEQRKGSIDAAKETSLMSKAGEINGDTSNKKNEASNVSRVPIVQKKLRDSLNSTPEMSSVPKVGLVLKKSRLSTAIERQKSAALAKSQQRNKNKNDRPEVSGKRNSKETSDAKGQKEKNLSAEKSRSSFLSRSITRAMSLMRQDKMQQNKNNKNNVENIARAHKNAQTVTSRTMLNPDQNNKSESENFSKNDVPVIEGSTSNNQNASSSSKQEKEPSDITKITRNENVPRIGLNNRPKSKLQAVLENRRTSQPPQENTTNVKKSDSSQDTKQRESLKDTKTEPELVKDKTAMGDFERNMASMEVPCTKIRFEEEANNCPCEQKNVELTATRCCCCCLPAVDCTCALTKTSTVCIVPKVVPEDICTPKFECCRIVDNCECNKPVVCNRYCKSGNVYRCEVPCIDCNKPKEKCRCRPTYVDCCNSNYQPSCNETIICVYCEHPRDKCVCRAPIRKCSYCGLSRDICKCREVYNGRPIVTDHDGDRKICVSAWTPRPEVRRYFSRNFNDFCPDSIDGCYCYKSYTNCGLDDLPYQRSSAFSDVMSELQQKMSDYACCQRCKKNPCCCKRNFDKKVDVEDRKGRCYVSTKERQRSRSPEMDHPRIKSPTNHRHGPDRNAQRRTLLPLSRICYSCKASPCRCKKGRTTTKRPRAKCYYCKSCPCTCIDAREVNKSRSCKCGDSPCRVKEKETVLCGKAFDDVRKKNEEKVFRTRESNTCVCPLTKPYCGYKNLPWRTTEDNKEEEIKIRR